jgi:hypothetical protein
MPKIESYRKQARQLVRWHRERNYSVGEKVRLLERYRDLEDAAVLAMEMPLTLARRSSPSKPASATGRRSSRLPMRYPVRRLLRRRASGSPA